METDPNGINVHAPGAKVDKGKVRVGLMFKGFPRALLKVAEVVTFGAEKYSPLGFLDVPDAVSRYDDAKGRHLLKGYIEDKDSDSDLTHMAHEAWNALAKLEIRLRREEEVLTQIDEGIEAALNSYLDRRVAEANAEFEDGAIWDEESGEHLAYRKEDR